MVPFVVLIILDGWGVAPNSAGNAIARANTPNFDKYWAAYPHTTLSASGEAVGLPRGEAGNTETGHLNLGAGRIVYQDLLRINMSIIEEKFFTNDAFIKAVKHAKDNNSNLHLMGLVGTGGVHSSLDHLFALIELCRRQDFKRVFLHLFTDGRDSAPNSAENYISQINSLCKKTGIGKIATIMGRYWAMDRDKRWDRTEKAYLALTASNGYIAKSAEEAIQKSYEKGVTDEFINPTIIEEKGAGLPRIKSDDSVIFYNFRIDRPRQLTKAFVAIDFENAELQKDDFDPYSVDFYKTHNPNLQSVNIFKRTEKLKNICFVTMTEYSKKLGGDTEVAFPPTVIAQPLGGVLSVYDEKLLRIAESEKERFVTFYFDGQRELGYPGDDKKIVPSKKVATYDLVPEMSAREILQTFMTEASGGNASKYKFVLINFANADMVGHTGNFEATVKACEVIDECLGEIVQRVSLMGGVTLITADHGNAEQMLNAGGEIHTEHTVNPVPFLVIGDIFFGKTQTNLQSGILADVAPTVLSLLGIKPPPDMTGRVLVE